MVKQVYSPWNVLQTKYIILKLKAFWGLSNLFSLFTIFPYIHIAYVKEVKSQPEALCF